MRRKSAKISDKKDCRKRFLFLPGIFLLCGYLVFYVAILPVAAPLMSVFRLTFMGPTPGTSGAGTVSVFSGDTGVNSGTLKASELHYPEFAEHFGNVTVDGTAIDAPVYYGDTVELLNKGACMSMRAGIPGGGSGVFLSAHNNTDFRDLQAHAEVGALVHIETHYGSYVYEVVDKKIAHRTDETAYEQYLDPEKETLVMYTCQKENGISLSLYRCYLICEYVSGPVIDFSK